MSRALKLILFINLAIIAALVFIYPHLMIAPGKLTAAHGKLEQDCFACHAPWRGNASERCTRCHVPADIGRLTTTGQPIVPSTAASKRRAPTPFHHKLARQDCTACHSDHAGVERFHPKVHFRHDLLDRATRDQCQGCHRQPADTLHEKIEGNCLQCHAQNHWKPASFDHAKYFLLDRDHNTSCTTCHEGSDFKSYTCYGCHEHTPAGIRAEHEEEGVRDFRNCVECHRSADEHDIRSRDRPSGRGNDGHGERRRTRERKHDD